MFSKFTGTLITIFFLYAAPSAVSAQGTVPQWPGTRIALLDTVALVNF
jgi:hypothetical protein